MSASELFAARSRMKLENARKLVKPELVTGESRTREVSTLTTPPIVSKVRAKEKPKAKGLEELKIAKAARRLSTTAKPQEKSTVPQEKSTVKPDWKPSKSPKKDTEEPIRTSRYKQGRSFNHKEKTSTTTKESLEENKIEQTTKAVTPSRYQKKPKFNPKARGNAIRGPKHSNVVVAQNDPIPTVRTAYKAISLASRGRKSQKPEVSSEKPKTTIPIPAKNGANNKNTITSTSRTSKEPSSTTSQSEVDMSTTVQTLMSFSTSVRTIKLFESESTTEKARLEKTTLNPGPVTSPRLNVEILTKGGLPDFIENATPKSSEPELAIEILTKDGREMISATTGNSLGNEVSGKYGKFDATTKSHASRRVDLPAANAIYRGQSEAPVIVYPEKRQEPISVSITPKAVRFHATVKTDETSPPSVTQEPVVNVRVSNDSSSSQQQSGISDASNGASGSSIFSPTKSLLLAAGNATLLEQIRSTVAPFLNSLGSKSPVFSNSFRGVNSAVRFSLFCISMY